MRNLDKIGLGEWFRARLDSEKAARHEIARVAAVQRESYLIAYDEVAIFAELSGNLLNNAESALDFPTVGDWVYADFYDEATHAVVHGIIPRKNSLKRKAAGRQIDYQLIAANIDVAFIVQSLNDNFNLRRLERYLVIVNECGIEPVVLLSKSDLKSPSEILDIEKSVACVAPEALVITYSAVTGEHVNSITGNLKPGLSYCILGSSGVGKTTLLNALAGTEDFQTRSVSKVQNKGRHTTTSRQLVRLENDALIIDTPGMRELGSMSVDTGLDETFSEIAELTLQCKFSDCSHTNEKGCAIREAIQNEQISKARYQNYLKIRKESEFNEMSYVEKRKKDKDFGKMIKKTIKGKHH